MDFITAHCKYCQSRLEVTVTWSYDDPATKENRTADVEVDTRCDVCEPEPDDLVIGGYLIV